ncbi:Fcf2-domain-containing protein [Paxillus ammoniavirescens]|nr:Fcf2-domain-containing protein [Paxillus ammoniavirescens]
MPSNAMSTAVINKGKQKVSEEPRGFFPLGQDDASTVTSHSQHSQSDSGSDSEDSSSSDSSSDFDSEEDITPEYLQSLLNKARQNVREEARRAKMLQEEKQAAGFGEKEIIKFGGEEEEDKPLPPMDPGALPPPYFEFGTTRHEAPTSVRDPDIARAEAASSSVSVPPPPEDPNAGWKQLTKKQRKAVRACALLFPWRNPNFQTQMKNKTAGPGWFDLPAPVEADLPRLYREVESLRLRNQLDPKRFYKKEEGEAKGIKGLPKHFAIGTILPSTTPFNTTSTDNLPRSHRKRTLVDELVDDAEARRYAKKKFEELQSARGARGRNTLHKKNALRKPKW